MKHTCDCPRCMVHYKTYIPILMAQVSDLQSQNQELQPSDEDLSQALAPVTGISQSYGDPRAQILSTVAKQNEVVWGCQGESRVVAAKVADHSENVQHQHGQHLSAVETIVKHYAIVASRLDAWD